MLNRPATKIEMNMEADLREFEEMKNLRMQNPIEFERIFHTNNILQLLPNYQKHILICYLYHILFHSIFYRLNNANNNDKKFSVNEFDPHEFNFSEGKNIEEFSLNNEFSPKEFNLGDVTIQEKNSNKKDNKSNEKVLPGVKLFSTPDNNN